MTEERIEKLFLACDLNRSGYIEEEDFRALCAGDLALKDDEFDQLFRELDRDGDGRISLADFTKGFESAQDLFFGDGIVASSNGQAASRHSSAGDVAWQSFYFDYGKELSLLSSQEHVCELYQQLQASEVPQLIALFETIILGVAKDLKSQHSEVNRLEKTLRRSNDANQDHLKQLEDEMETQMLRLEQRIRKEEKENADLEKLDMRRQFESEISDLQANLKRFNKLENRFQRDTGRDEMVFGLKNQVDILMQENRQLKNTLTESETNLAITRSDLATAQSHYEEQRGAIVQEKSTINAYEQEHESLTRQLHLLQDANKKLQDTNDDLRAALEASKQMSRNMKPNRKPIKTQGSFMNDYIDEEMPTENEQLVSSGSQNSIVQSLPQSKRGSIGSGTELTRRKRSRSNHVSRASSLDEDALAACDPGMRASPYQHTMDYDNWDVDSGNSTMRDPYEDSEYDPNSIEDDISRLGSPTLMVHEDEHMQSIAENDLSRDGSVSDITVVQANYTMAEKPLTPRQVSPVPSQRSVDSRTSSRPGSGKRRALPSVPMRPITPSNAPPERMYKIVMAGDAAVGKSSFILRLCKGIFHNNLNSTLGVDFQMKTLEIDGVVTSLQLWDTAGQERFRSIAKSYFRRADGVLMLYDVTCDRSFINVRDWMEAVQDGAQKELPIMLCGNKVDARAETVSKGKRCVTTEDGERLAKSYGALFVETSAKDGDNILEAVNELARRLHEKEDLEVKSAGMKLDDEIKPKEESKCC